MSSNVTASDILLTAKNAGLEAYTGKYTELGGGEINDTFLLECASKKAVLRVAKYSEQTSLEAEAATLETLDFPEVPKLICFNKQLRIQNRLWVMESYIPGKHITRLSVPLFHSLGTLLARIHARDTREDKTDVWNAFLQRRKQYGNEEALLRHPDEHLRVLVNRTRDYVKHFQAAHSHLPHSIIHGDATPTNILVNGEALSLIDWEFSHFNDPMAEFSTIYYDDMDYNDGKWRVHITPGERSALFDGYRTGGGNINEERIQLWIILDKLGASLYLYWRLHESGRELTDEQALLYNRELGKLVSSLQRHFTTS